MLKSTLIGACLAASLAVASSGCATRAPADQPKTAGTAGHPGCLRSTDTRIEDPSQPCSSYTQTQIQQTGEVNVADALKKLDPRVQ